MPDPRFPVDQSDRERAAECLEHLGLSAAGVREGDRDGDFVVKQFVAHRLSAEVAG